MEATLGITGKKLEATIIMIVFSLSSVQGHWAFVAELWHQ